MKLITSDPTVGGTASGVGTPAGDPPTTEDTTATKVDLTSVIEVLTRNLQNTAVPTKVAVLRWIYHLHLKMGDQMFRHIDETFPVLLKTLSDPSDEVVLLALEVLSEIVSFSAKAKDGMSQSLHGYLLLEPGVYV